MSCLQKYCYVEKFICWIKTKRDSNSLMATIIYITVYLGSMSLSYTFNIIKLEYLSITKLKYSTENPCQKLFHEKVLFENWKLNTIYNRNWKQK